MIARLTLAATAFVAVAAPALAAGQANRVAPEERIRQMSEYLEAVADPGRGVFIRGYTGQWYYATVQGQCPRLQRGAQLRFNASPGNVFDRNSTIRADGWRCRIASVTRSGGP